jgi:histone-lysine N-methyltransferase EZH2
MTLLPDPTDAEAVAIVEPAELQGVQADARNDRSLTVPGVALDTDTGGPSEQFAEPRSGSGCAEMWSELEQSIFFKLFFIFGDEYCRIAACLGTKTCGQVWAQATSFATLLMHESLLAETVATSEDVVDSSSAKAKGKKGKRKKMHKRATQRAARTELPRAYQACEHHGSCMDPEVDCPCAKRGFCEKFCGCDAACRNRPPYCQCKSSCRTRACPCYAANRECDPDMCGNCVLSITAAEEVSAAGGAGGGAAGEPNGKEETGAIPCCSNFQIQARQRKHIQLAESTTHGWGAFVAQDVDKNDLITEYLGEVISQDEADRRGKIYDKLNKSYLFNLDENYVVDAARKGCKMKFANHADNPNCVSRVMMVPTLTTICAFICCA